MLRLNKKKDIQAYILFTNQINENLNHKRTLEL